MLAYDWLKQNPQIRHRQMIEDWSAISKDSSVPFAVKQELNELMWISSMPTDAMLFFHQEYVKQFVIEGVKGAPKLDAELFHSKTLEYCYTYLQKNDMREALVRSAFRFLVDLNDAKLYSIDLTYEEIAWIIYDIYAHHQNRRAAGRFLSDQLGGNGVDFYVLSALMGHTLNVGAMFRPSNILCACEEDLIRKSVTNKNVLDIEDMIINSGWTSAWPKFKSINEISKAHDDRIALETEEVLRDKGGITYEYHPTLVEIVKKHGFTLPASPADLVLRGKHHHNCVGTYDARHQSTKTKLLFTQYSTLEVEFDVQHALIAGTRIVQHKGVNNRDKEITLPITEMRIELTGKPVDILYMNVRGIK